MRFVVRRIFAETAFIVHRKKYNESRTKTAEVAFAKQIYEYDSEIAIMKMLRRKAKTALNIFRRGGLRGLRRHWKKLARQRREDKAYQKWLSLHGTISAGERGKILAAIDSFEFQPLISVILPVYNIEEKWLRKCIGSVTDQIYTNWELCIADDASTEPHVARVLKEFAAADARIKAVFRETNGHISAASNSALELADGEFSVLLDHDDELSPDALFYVAKTLNEDRTVSMIYSDEDKIDENGRRFYPSFKPDWSRDLFYSINLVTHLSAYRTDVLRKIGGFRAGYEGSQDYDLALRVIEQISDEQIRHIPRILYHWRAIKGSVALSGGEKSYAHERARLALRSHFERIGTNAEVLATVHELHRVRYALPQPLPKAAVIIDAYSDSDFSRERVSRIAETAYSNFEIVVIGRGDLLIDGITCVSSDAESGAERLNSAAERTDAELLVFLDAGVEPKDPDWLDELARFAFREKIGAVGGKIVTPDGIVLSNGLVTGPGGAVGHAHAGLDSEELGNMWRNLVVGNFSAVSGSAMAIRAEVFRSAGGFDADSFPEDLFDADLCLRLREKGFRIVSTPYAEFSAQRIRPRKISDNERREFDARWHKNIERDPFYSEHFSKKDGTFSIAVQA